MTDECLILAKNMHCSPYGLPARAELINEAFSLAVGEDAVAFSQDYSTMLNDSASIFFPIQSINIGQLDMMVEQIWLAQAFDRYLLDNGNLETSLQDFAGDVETFRSCVTNIDAQSLDNSEYLEEVLQCAVNIDETLEDRFAI